MRKDDVPAVRRPLVPPDGARAPTPAVSREGDRPAVVGPDGSWSYRQLDERTNRLARLLVARGAGPGAVVGIALPRSVEAAVALLAVARAGAAHLVLDPDDPEERRRMVVADAVPALVVGLRETVAGLPAGPDLVVLDDPLLTAELSGHRADRLADPDRTRPVGPGDPAELAYGSAATGRPVPVLVPQAVTVGRLWWRRSVRPLTASDRVLVDAATPPEELWRALCDVVLVGATLVVAWRKDPGHLVDLVRSESATVVHVSPGTLEQLPGISTAGDWRRVRQVVCGTDAVRPEVASRAVVELGIELVGSYGPPETGGDATAWTVDRAGPGRTATIGRPTWNTRVYVLDQRLAPVPVGVTGELYIGGTTLAHGYAHRPGLTAERFVADPFDPPGRMYRTGEPARFRPDGVLQLVPPADPPVPVGGTRPAGADSRVPARQAPGTPDEELLCGLVAETLGLVEVRPDDNFFALGGHSLSVVALVGRIHRTFGVALAVSAVFDAPTIADLLGRLVAAESPRPRVRRVPRPPAVPLSAAQLRMWFLYQLAGPNGTDNVSHAFRLDGPLDEDALAAALVDVATRHEPLRTLLVADRGVPRQQVLEVAAGAPVLSVEAVDEAGLADLLARRAGHPFDLATEVPFRPALVRLGPHRHVLLLVLHHVATDGWSLRPLLADLSTAYAARLSGRAPAWTPLPVDYADYALWQQELEASGHLDRQLEFWRSFLAGAPAGHAVPTDHPRPATAAYAGEAVDLVVDQRRHARLAELARDNRTTVFMVVHAALAALVSGLGPGDDVVIGTPTAGRTDDRLRELVGCFVNSVTLRSDTSGDPGFRTLLHRVREADVSAFGHQDVPFDRVVQAMNPLRSLDRHPLFQVVLSMQTEADDVGLWLPGVRTTREFRDPAVAKVDLTFAFTERRYGDGAAAGMYGVLVYRRDLFRRATAERLAARLSAVLAAVADDPDQPLSALAAAAPPDLDARS